MGESIARQPSKSVCASGRLAVSAATSEAELADLSGDERLLRRIAEGSGGQLLPPEQLASLPDRLAEIRSRQSQFTQYPLWDSPYLYALVVASLSAEWALRKRWGLA